MLPYKRHNDPIYSILDKYGDYDWYLDDWDRGYDYDYDDCYNGAIFEYVPEDQSDKESSLEYFTETRRYSSVPVRRKLLRHRPFLRIDMMSIYSKEMMRQKKIDIILEGEKDTSNTIKNIINEKF